MGFFKNVKSSVVGAEARRAREEGRTVYVAMLNVPLTQSSSAMPSGSVSGWAEMIETVEAEGWRLDMWTVVQDKKDRPQAYPLFRLIT